jgi:hypothetical protein
VSDAVQEQADQPHGTALLPRDLTPEQLRTAPVLGSVDALLIDELSEDEDDAFARAIGS